MGSDRKTLLSAIGLCRLSVLPNEPLDMNGSLNLTISYLLKDELTDLE